MGVAMTRAGLPKPRWKVLLCRKLHGTGVEIAVS